MTGNIILSENQLKMHNRWTREDAIDKFAQTLINRLSDATTDVNGVTNLINEVAEQLKEKRE